MAAPEVAKTAESMSGKALVLKVDTEAIPELSQRYNVQGIPNFIVFRDSKVAFQQAGLVKADTMMGWLS
jgi:thioredoxin 2